MAVRQTPLTAMLAPGLRSESTVLHHTRKRAPMGRGSSTSTVPSSSMIPVNILSVSLAREPGFDGEFVGRDRVEFDFAELNRFGAAASAGATRHGQRFQSAQNFRRVV